MDLGQDSGVRRFLRSDADGSGTTTHVRHKARDWLDHARSSNRHEQRALVECAEDSIQLERHFAKTSRYAVECDLRSRNGVFQSGDRRWWCREMAVRCINRKRLLNNSPCMWRTRIEPACSCRSSTFWVQRNKRSCNFWSSLASAKCAGFGLALPGSPAIKVRLQFQLVTVCFDS